MWGQQLNQIRVWVFKILYYNSDIWLILSLNPRLFQLLSASAATLKMITFNYDYFISFVQTHTSLNRATPKMFMAYKHALILHRVFNNSSNSNDWLSLNSQLIFNARDQFVKVVDTSKLKIGKNLTVNRIRIVNGNIMYDWLNLSFETYQLKCKSIFL